MPALSDSEDEGVVDKQVGEGADKAMPALSESEDGGVVDRLMTSLTLFTQTW